MMKHFVLSIILIIVCSYIAVAQKTNAGLRIDLEKLYLQVVGTQTANDRLSFSLESLNPKLPEYILKPVYNLKIDTVFDSEYHKNLRKQLKKYPDFRHFVFTVSGGWGIRIVQESTKAPEELIKYRKGLKSGYCFDVSTSYFISPNIALGMCYSYYNLFNSNNNISYEYPIENHVNGSRKDKIDVHFFGPALTLRVIPQKNKLYASYDFMFGYSMYNNSMTLNDIKYNYTGNSFGFASSIGVDFLISKDYSAGIALKLSAASVNDLRITNHKVPPQEIDNIGNLSRISLVFTLKMFR